MFQLFETICVKNGIPQNLFWHEQRMNQARSELWNEDESLNLESYIKIPNPYKIGVVRCRISYGPNIQSIDFFHYAYRRIYSLKLVPSDDIEYQFKHCDRSHLDRLLAKKGDCDEIIILKNGFVTDSSFSNLIFFDGINWITSNTPLLAGTCRARLLDQGKIIERAIRQSEVKNFLGVKLINAMRDIDDQDLIQVENICG